MFVAFAKFDVGFRVGNAGFGIGVGEQAVASDDEKKRACGENLK